MANGVIATTTATGGAAGVVGGPIGIAAGAITGYLSASGVFGGTKKKVVPPTPIYEKPIFWEITGMVAFIVVLVVAIRAKG